MDEDTVALISLSPLDGRYRKQTLAVAEYFSEKSLIKYRIKVEIEYLLALAGANVDQSLEVLKVEANQHILKNLYNKFTIDDARKVKDIEKVTNHDVKAIEYFIKEKIPRDMKEISEFVHFGLTSQDINNVAIPTLLRECVLNVYLPKLKSVMAKLDELYERWKEVAMLARTHGQAATPTRLGKEIKVFHYRLTSQLKFIENHSFRGKFGGAIGSFNAHFVAYPNIDWETLADQLLKKEFGLDREIYTTQISSYDDLAELSDNMRRINVILIDLCRDVWQYISMDYFKLKVIENEVGSSTMPHKVNPIDFENAEGNLGIGNSIFQHFSDKLPISRLQRDLSDSTVLRNLGVPIGHSLIAFNSILRGLTKLEINEKQIYNDLENNWAVVSEAIQTVLRREKYPNPYEELKSFTRGNHIDKEMITRFIDHLQVSNAIKEELKNISPHNYIGILPLQK